LAEYWPSILMGVMVAAGVVLAHWMLSARTRIPQLAPEPTRPSVEPAFDNPTQKRNSLRRDGNPTKIHVALPGDTSNPVSGYVLDRSLGGLRMSLDKEFDPGMVLTVRPAAALEMTPWYDVEVLRCQNIEQTWHLSCRFLHSPPYSILMLFG
jgi:hypothetical protein